MVVDPFMTGATCVMCRRGVHYREGRVACDGCDLPTDSCLCETVEGLGPPTGGRGESGGSGIRALPSGRPVTPPRRPTAQRPPDQRPPNQGPSGHPPSGEAGFRIPAETDPGVPSEPETAVHIARAASELDARAAEWERETHATGRSRSGRRRIRRRRSDVDPAQAAAPAPVSDDEGGGGSMTGSGREPEPTGGATTPERRLVRRRKRRG